MVCSFEGPFCLCSQKLWCLCSHAILRGIPYGCSRAAGGTGGVCFFLWCHTLRVPDSTYCCASASSCSRLKIDTRQSCSWGTETPPLPSLHFQLSAMSVADRSGGRDQQGWPSPVQLLPHWFRFPKSCSTIAAPPWLWWCGCCASSILLASSKNNKRKRRRRRRRRRRDDDKRCKDDQAQGDGLRSSLTTMTGIFMSSIPVLFAPFLPPWQMDSMSCALVFYFLVFCLSVFLSFLSLALSQTPSLWLLMCAHACGKFLKVLCCRCANKRGEQAHSLVPCNSKMEAWLTHPTCVWHHQ